MKLQKLFEAQRELDAHIEQQHPREEGENRVQKKILALQVELGELANELPEVFKFWSNKKNNTERALKEYVDGLHFILSIGLEKSFNDDDLLQFGSMKTNGLITQFTYLFEKIGDFRSVANYNNYQFIVLLFIGLGEMLGFTWEQIEEAYMEKNQINHKRQENQY